MSFGLRRVIVLIERIKFLKDYLKNGAKALLVVGIFIRWLKPTAIEFKIGFLESLLPSALADGEESETLFGFSLMKILKLKMNFFID